MSGASSQDSSPATRGRGTAKGGGGGGHKQAARLFDRYIAVDWSANDKPKGGKDSIWLAEAAAAGGQITALNIRTRFEAMTVLRKRLAEAIDLGERTLVGFDFPFGYPAGASSVLTGGDGWQALWELLSREIVDNEKNKSNRFVVADQMNERLADVGPKFWGCPAGAAGDHLSTKKDGVRFGNIAEFRQTERLAKGAKSVWQLHYNGCVGSQCLLGLAWLEKLRHDTHLGPYVSVWPYETDFERSISKPIILAEIYPSFGLKLDATIAIKDQAQVEAQVRLFQAFDQSGRLAELLSFPPGVDQAWRGTAVTEEGWILGVGHEALLS
jgi:precorrin-8X/cobalt-precorrin-8 methylmutase